MTILRWAIPVDDQWHQISHPGEVVHVGSRIRGVVEFWTGDDVEVHTVSDGTGRIISETYDPSGGARERWYRVYGTGMDTDGFYVASTYDAFDTALVWHLFSRRAPQQAQ